MHPTPTAPRPGRRLVIAAAGLATTLALTLAACGDDDDTDAAGDDTDGTAELSVTDVWARSSAQGQTRGAAYMVISGGGEDDRLLAASVPETVAGATEIHETVPADMEHMDGADNTSDDGMDEDMGAMTMQEVEALDIPAGESVVFEPGGYHVMLLDLVGPLESGDEFEIELDFETAGARTVTAEVRDG